MPDAPALLVLVGAATAGFVQGVSGFAVGLVAMAFWSNALAPQEIGPLIVLCSLLGQVMTIRAVLPSLDPRLAAPMLAGGLLGVPIGVALLPVIDAVWFQFGVGLLLAIYCPAMLFARTLPRVTAGGPWADAAVGVVGGVMGGLAGLGGPAPTLWCQLRGWDRDVQRALFQSFLVVTQAVALIGYLLTGAITARVVQLGVWILPCMLAPAFLGAMVYTRFSAEAFRRLVLLLLFVSGLALLGQAGPHLLAR